MATLQQFGVPLGAGTGRGGILMPKVKNRFRVKVYQFGTVNAVDFTRQVITVSRPNLTMAPQAVHAYNSISYYPGKAEWETISVTVRDDMTNSVSALCAAQMQRQMNFFTQTVLPAASDYKFGMSIQTLDGSDDGILENWTLEGCFLSQINYESFDYSSSDAMTIEMTVRFDNATSAQMFDANTISNGPEVFMTT